MLTHFKPCGFCAASAGEATVNTIAGRFYAEIKEFHINFMRYQMNKVIIPKNYVEKLDIYQTQLAIGGKN